MKTRTMIYICSMFFLLTSVRFIAKAERKTEIEGRSLIAASKSSARVTPPPTSIFSTVLLREDFSSASGSTPPSGWRNNTLIGVPTDKWHFDNPGARTVNIAANPPLAVFDSDFLSCNGSPENVALESPAFSAPLNSNIVLRFVQYFRANNVEGQEQIVEAFDGVNWVIVDSTKAPSADPDTVAIDITSQVAGASNARIRFRFKGNCSWFWFIDDVVVTETPIAPSTRLLFENFKAATGSTPPTGWTINRMVGQSYDVWRFDNPGGRRVRPPLAHPFAIFDSDSLSRLGGFEDVALESPAFNAPVGSTIMLSLDHFFHGDSGGRATIELFNGTAWVPCWDSTNSTRNPDTLNLNITSFVGGVNNAKVRFRWRGSWSWWWIVDNVVVTEIPGGGGSTGIVSDQFNDLALNTSVWTFENPRVDASYSLTGTQLSINLPAGVSHDITESGNYAPRVMQAVSNPLNFELYAKFDALMNQAYQTQGIQIWQDAANFLRLEFYGDGVHLNRLAWDFVNGVHQDEGSAGLGIGPVTPIYMKVKRQGNTWTQYWSTNGVDYTVGTTFARTLNVTKVGVYAGNVGFPESATPAFTGLIDYFVTSNPLPVQLAGFTATTTTSGLVRLDWITITETNNYGFEIQKAQTIQSGFQTVANSFIPGHGTTITPHHYSWTDGQSSAGMWFYRLKQIDLDGQVHYSDPVQVEVLTGAKETAPREFTLSQNYPNPFNPSTEIKFSVDENVLAHLEVYNILGQKVATLFDEVAQPGQFYHVRFGTNGMGSGMYFYKLTAGTKSQMRKMLLVK